MCRFLSIPQVLLTMIPRNSCFHGNTDCASVLYATSRRPAVSAKTRRHVCTTMRRCCGAPAGGGKAQPFRTPGRVRGYRSTPLAGTSGDERFLKIGRWKTKRAAQYDMGTTTGTCVPKTAQGLYVTARNASVPGFLSQLSPCERRSTPIDSIHQYVPTQH